jgi:hypothetical protein
LNSPSATNSLYIDASIADMLENTLAMPLDFFMNPCPLLQITHCFVCTTLCPVLASHTWHIHLQAQSDKVNGETCVQRLDINIKDHAITQRNIDQTKNKKKQ